VLRRAASITLSGMGEADRPKSEEIEAVRRLVVEAYGRHADELSRIAVTTTRNRALAQEVLQETFLRYFLTRMQGEAIASELSWLKAVMHDLILDWKRSSRLEADVTLEDADNTPAESVEARGAASMRLASIMKAAHFLAPREKECVNLRAQGLAYNEIASAMQIDVGTVGTLLNRAFEKLRRSTSAKEKMA
jgi:RNA polymerase sigma-70 factor (ECF subfamily)